MSFQVGPFQPAYQQTAGVTPPVVVERSSGGRYYAYSLDEPKKKKVVEVAVLPTPQGPQVKYVASFNVPIDILQDIQKVLAIQKKRKSLLQEQLDEIAEIEDITIILSEIQ